MSKNTGVLFSGNYITVMCTKMKSNVWNDLHMRELPFIPLSKQYFFYTLFLFISIDIGCLRKYFV